MQSTKGMKGFAGGALSGGALSLLMGNKKFRKVGGKVAAYGGVAALGAVAYHAYGQWKNSAQQAETPQAASAPPQLKQLTSEVNRFQQLPAAELEQQSQLVLMAMISAAKADGHIDAQEQQLLEGEFQRLGASPTEHQWIAGLLNGPADPAAVAKLAQSPEQAAEAYLASVLVTGADSFMERAYLDELARQLQLEEGLKEHLENTALNAIS